MNGMPWDHDQSLWSWSQAIMCYLTLRVRESPLLLKHFQCKRLQWHTCVTDATACVRTPDIAMHAGNWMGENLLPACYDSTWTKQDIEKARALKSSDDSADELEERTRRVVMKESWASRSRLAPSSDWVAKIFWSWSRVALAEAISYSVASQLVLFFIWCLWVIFTSVLLLTRLGLMPCLEQKKAVGLQQVRSGPE